MVTDAFLAAHSVCWPIQISPMKSGEPNDVSRQLERTHSGTEPFGCDMALEHGRLSRQSGGQGLTPKVAGGGRCAEAASGGGVVSAWIGRVTTDPAALTDFVGLALGIVLGTVWCAANGVVCGLIVVLSCLWSCCFVVVLRDGVDEDGKPRLRLICLRRLRAAVAPMKCIRVRHIMVHAMQLIPLRSQDAVSLGLQHRGSLAQDCSRRSRRRPCHSPET